MFTITRSIPDEFTDTILLLSFFRKKTLYRKITFNILNYVKYENG